MTRIITPQQEMAQQNDAIASEHLADGAAGGRVCAIVVTYNRAGLLRACLLALEAQTRAVDAVLVVDNASTDGTRGLVRGEFPGATVLALAANGGGAGGFHAGMKWAYGRGYDWLWLMDDDARPAADCLGRLLAHARPNAVLVPVQQDSAGRQYGINVWRKRHIEATAEVTAGGRPVSGPFLFAFVGPLIARAIVSAAGLPNKDFFIWFDDYEYGLRIQGRTTAAIVVVPDAVIFHDYGERTRQVRFLGRRSNRSEQPPWKTYYGTRNTLYTLTRTRRYPQELLLFSLVQFRVLIMDLVYGPARRERLRMRLLGFRDGLLGRLGRRI